MAIIKRRSYLLGHAATICLLCTTIGIFIPQLCDIYFLLILGTGNVQWVVTAQERANYDAQFDKMNPINGFLRGDQARNFFLQSSLPPAVLGQIW